MTEENRSQPQPQSPYLRVESTPARQRVASGETAIFAATIENRSDGAQSQSVEIQGLPQEWFTFDFDEEHRAFPGESRRSTLIVSVPQDAQAAEIEFRIVARAGAEESTAQCSLEVMARAGAASAPPKEQAEQAEPVVSPPPPPPPPPAPGVSLSPASVTWTGGVGEEERLTISVRNRGSSETEYVVSLNGLGDGWYSPSPKLRATGGAAIEAELRIHPPADAKRGEYPFAVRVAVDESPEIAAEAKGQLTVREPEPQPRQRPRRPPAEPTSAGRAGTPVLPPEVSLAPRTTFRFAPGEVTAAAILSIQNRSRLIELYDIRVLDIPEDWCVLAASEIRLEPGARQEVPLRLTPKSGPGFPAGDYSFRLSVTPHSFPDSSAEVGGLITIVGVSAFDASLTPATAQGRKEKFKLTLRNSGGLPLNLLVEGTDPEGMCKFEIPPASNLEPGQEEVLPVWVGAKRNGLLGAAETFDYRLRVVPAGAESKDRRTFDAQFVHQPFLTFRFAFIAIFLALLVAAVGVAIALGPSRIKASADWVDCRFGDSQQLEKGTSYFIKEKCGGAPYHEQCLNMPTRPSACTRFLEEAQAQTVSPTPSPTPEPATAVPLACTPTRDFQVGARVVVVFNAPDRTRMRDNPGKSASEVAALEKNTPATVTGGPECADGVAWWQVGLDGDGPEGWVAELDPDDKDPLLQPQ